MAMLIPVLTVFSEMIKRFDTLVSALLAMVTLVDVTHQMFVTIMNMCQLMLVAQESSLITKRQGPSISRRT